MGSRCAVFMPRGWRQPEAMHHQHTRRTALLAATGACQARRTTPRCAARHTFR